MMEDSDPVSLDTAALVVGESLWSEVACCPGNSGQFQGSVHCIMNKHHFLLYSYTIVVF